MLATYGMTKCQVENARAKSNRKIMREFVRRENVSRLLFDPILLLLSL